MKNLRLIIFVCCILFSGFVFAACGCNIQQPIVTVNGCLVSWTAIADAGYYEVMIDDHKENVKGTSINLIKYLQKGDIKNLRVKAKAQGWFKFDSEYSDAFSIEVASQKVATPQNFEVSSINRSYKAMWSEVSLPGEQVNYCLCFVSESGDSKYFQTSHNYFDINGNLDGYGTYTASVFAYINDVGRYGPSNFSEEYQFNYETLLTTPRSVSMNNRVLSWSNMSGVQSYNVSLLGGNTKIINANTSSSDNRTSCNIDTLKNADDKLRDKPIVFAGVQSISLKEGLNSPYSNFLAVYNSEMSKDDFASCKYTYLGNTFDFCADDFNELKTLIHFTLYYRIEKIIFTTTPDYATSKSIVIGDNCEINKAIDDYAEIMNISYYNKNIFGSGDTFNKYSLEVKYYHPEYPRKVTQTEGNPSQFIPNNSWKLPGATKLDYTSEYYRGSNFDDYDFPINKREKTEMVYTSDQLYLALDNGAKPIFPSECPASLVYDAAKDVLRQIIDESMDEYQKVLAIYEWICYNAKYDYNLYEESKKQENEQNIHNFRGFYVEGMLFDNGKAVCDGIAKTFSLMCGIENITCYKAIGKARSTNHAWNKVYIQVPGAETKAWFVVDATWGDQTIKDDVFGKVEYLSHRYFLKRDIDLSDHQETTIGAKSADTSFNYYAVTYYSAKASLNIQNEIQLAAFKNYILSNKSDIDYIEFKYATNSKPTALDGYDLIPLGINEVGYYYYAYAKKKA